MGWAGATLTPAGAPDPAALAGLVGLGLLLTVPPLYFLQRAVPLLSTFALSALTALGPLVIFGLQRIEGRVDYAAITLAGLLIYVTGSLLAAVAALRNPQPACQLPVSPRPAIPRPVPPSSSGRAFSTRRRQARRFRTG